MDMKVRAIDVKEVIWEFKKHSKEHCTAETGKCLAYVNTIDLFDNNLRETHKTKACHFKGTSSHKVDVNLPYTLSA
jgi:uncharacterized protein (DUF427 family)